MIFRIMQQDIDMANAWRIARRRYPMPADLPFEFIVVSCNCPVAIALQRTLDRGDIQTAYSAAEMDGKEYELRAIGDGPPIAARITDWDNSRGMEPFDAEIVGID